jgi:hypothetical protein
MRRAFLDRQGGYDLLGIQEMMDAIVGPVWKGKVKLISADSVVPPCECCGVGTKPV